VRGEGKTGMNKRATNNIFAIIVREKGKTGRKKKKTTNNFFTIIAREEGKTETRKIYKQCLSF